MANEIDSEYLKEVLLQAMQRATQQKIDSSLINEGMNLRDDLNLDSLGMIETVWEIEEKLHIHIDEKSLRSILTVGDIMRVVSELVQEKLNAIAAN